MNRHPPSWEESLSCSILREQDHCIRRELMVGFDRQTGLSKYVHEVAPWGFEVDGVCLEEPK